MKLFIINLSREERNELVRLTTTGRHAARKVQHARILLKADEGLIDEQIAEHLDVSVRTVERVRQRCAQEGITAALNSRKRPPGKPKLDGEGEARLVQLACSEPPEGRQRWTLHLLADKLVELEVVDSISHETVRKRLKKRTETVANTAILHPA
jgi:transposase